MEEACCQEIAKTSSFQKSAYASIIMLSTVPRNAQVQKNETATFKSAVIKYSNTLFFYYVEFLMLKITCQIISRQ